MTCLKQKKAQPPMSSDGSLSTYEDDIDRRLERLSSGRVAPTRIAEEIQKLNDARYNLCVYNFGSDDDCGEIFSGAARRAGDLPPEPEAAPAEAAAAAPAEAEAAAAEAPAPPSFEVVRLENGKWKPTGSSYDTLEEAKVAILKNLVGKKANDAQWPHAIREGDKWFPKSWKDATTPDKIIEQWFKGGVTLEGGVYNALTANYWRIPKKHSWVAQTFKEEVKVLLIEQEKGATNLSFLRNGQPVSSKVVLYDEANRTFVQDQIVKVNALGVTVSDLSSFTDAGMKKLPDDKDEDWVQYLQTTLIASVKQQLEAQQNGNATALAEAQTQNATRAATIETQTQENTTAHEANETLRTAIQNVVNQQLAAEKKRTRMR